MKLTRIFTLGVLLFLGQYSFAQYGGYGYGNGYGNGYYGSGYGRSSQMGGMQDMQQSSKPKEVPVEETASKIMEDMTEALKLDALQELAIKNVIIESINLQGILSKNESMGQEAKIEEYKSLSENTNKKINSFLNPDQQEAYKVYLEERGKASNKKKKKKKE